ncbi:MULTISPECIES: DsrE family protein [Pantoea]|jgi:intracellular sulfur oxidation DsrE/DsrF family protein|uniref:DsrE family protein n=1 Tax=Pantoea brenneri TaxID=472694 RepID=A0A7Y6NDU6_9GAMM|nr:MULTISPECIES: DsrE family protein [Pantoea]MBZ6394875.1 DsrE family protein [Pantoea sp.]MBZ6438630.1 DsrE family protein [Pantoea sp.]MDU4126396.1 DsrE family protein [Pantoea sp.]MDU7871060.1 DsrE family protein [Pantoea sp.]NUY41805.1 DsrE family protein [Pantoea brenneri]
MRSAVSYVLIAIMGGVVGAVVTQSGTLYDKVAQHLSSEPQEPEGFWSTPAIEGYGKIHYEADAAFKPVAGLSNKIVFQITRSDGAMTAPNLGLERVARVVNLYIASGVPADQLKFVVSVTGDATPAMLDNAHFRQFYGIDNPNLKLIDELNKTGVKVSVCDQSVAFHHYPNNWIDKSVVHALSSPTTVSTLQNQGYAWLAM